MEDVAKLTYNDSELPLYIKFLNHTLSINPLNVSKRRLSSIADYEGKTRVIAIGDIGSQTVLKPLHDYTMNLLKGLNSDLTYNHDKCIRRIKRY